MDWLIDRDDPQSIEQALSQIGSHLQRHAAFDEGVDDSLHALRSEVQRLTPADGAHALVRVHLDWRGEVPLVGFAAVTDADLADKAGLRPGEAVPAACQADLDAVSEDLAAELTLKVERRAQDTFEAGIPPMARIDADPRRDGPLSVAVALAAAAEAHPTANPAQMATLAGTALADSIAATDEPRDATAVARLFVEAQEAMGSQVQALRTDEGRIELAVTQCPCGDGVSGSQSLCYVSTGLAGRLAARVNGTAVVMLEKAIAAGDHECHLKLWLDVPQDEVRGERHDWPPSAGNPSGPAPNLDLSLNLPRESGSVPVVRRLAAQALRAFGVDDDDIYDVQLAISEACANVIDHAADTDTYEVKVELAADRCAITVVDQGGGFDATAVPLEAELSAEAGRGVALMRALVDNVAFRSEPQVGAVVHMVKSLEYDPSHPLWRRTPE